MNKKNCFRKLKRTSDVPQMEQLHSGAGRYLTFVLAVVLFLRAVSFSVLADESGEKELFVGANSIATEEVEEAEIPAEDSQIENEPDTTQNDIDYGENGIENSQEATSEEELHSEHNEANSEDAKETKQNPTDENPGNKKEINETEELLIEVELSNNSEDVPSETTVSGNDAGSEEETATSYIYSERTFESTFSGTNVKITGFLPEGLLCTVEEIKYLDNYEDIVSFYLPEDTLYQIKRAYDINLYLDGEIYEPEEHGTFVTVTIKNLDESANGYVVHRIEDDNTITEIQANTEANADTGITSVSFDATHFTVYTIGEETVSTDDLTVVEGYPATYLGLTCTLYDNGLMTVEGIQAEDSSNSTYTKAPWYQNNAVQTIYANYNANGFSQEYMFFQACEKSFVTGELFHTENVTDMANMFGENASLANADLSKMNTSSVTEMRALFYNDSKLAILDLSNFNLPSLTSAGDMLKGCLELSNIKAPYNNAIPIPLGGTFYINGDAELPCTEVSAKQPNSFLLQKTPDTSWQKDYEYTLDDTAMTITLNNYIGNDTDIVVPRKAVVGEKEYATCLRAGTLETYTYVADDEENYTAVQKTGIWKSGSDTIQSLALEEGVKLDTNCDAIFSNLYSLTSIDLSNVDTSNVTSMRGMFAHCTSLTQLNLSNFNTAKVRNMFYMFSFCEQLQELNLSNFNTSQVTNMNGMFQKCTSLKTIDLSNLDTSNVRYMEYMFRSCTAMTTLNVNHFNTTKVQTMLGMFSNCKSLTALDLSNFVTTNVTDMSFMFDDCSSLNTLKISSFDTSNVQNMKCMFQSCKKLESIEVSNFKTSKVTNMSSMFFKCKLLSELDVTSFDTSIVTNMSDMFYGCESLTTLNLSNFDTSSVTNMNSMFARCVSLTLLNIDGFDTYKVKSMEDMFNNCYSLKNLNVSDFNTSNVTNMCGMFNNCYSLTTINVSNFDTSKVTDMHNMFCNCSNLETLDLSNFNTVAVQDMTMMFMKNLSLKSLDISSFVINSTTKVTQMFGCLCYSQTYELYVNNGITDEICKEQTGMDLETYIRMVYGFTDDNPKLEIVKAPKTCQADVVLPCSYYTHPDNTEYVSLPTGTSESTVLYLNKWENGYALTTPVQIALENGKSEFEMTFVPEKDFEENASVVVTFAKGTTITTRNDSADVVVDKNIVVFTEETQVTITITASDIDKKKAGTYEGDLEFTIKKVMTAP